VNSTAYNIRERIKTGFATRRSSVPFCVLSRPDDKQHCLYYPGTNKKQVLQPGDRLHLFVF
jgi:hypothetical protein